MDRSQSVGDALATYYQANGFEPPTVAIKWARIKLGPIPAYVYNSRARVRALRLHDLHHLATGYATDVRGEAEQSAWELAAGCHHHWFAWAINAAGSAIGLVVAPIRTLRAFARGWRCQTLYRGEYGPSLLTGTVADLRVRLRLE